MRFAANARTAAVIGGGLLGLEAARGLLNWGLDTHVVHLMPHLMEAQIDAAAGAVLRRQLEELGLHAHLDKRTSAVLGNGHVRGLEFADGSTLDCDLVVIAAGIRPNVRLAVEAGLEVKRGIVVGDDLACVKRPACLPWASAPSIAAVSTGWSRPCGNKRRGSPIGSPAGTRSAIYSGSSVSTKLKVMGVDLAVMGDKEPVDDDDEVVSYSEPSSGVYKKLILRHDRLAGAIVIGDGAIVPSLLQSFAEETALAENRAELLFPTLSAAFRGRRCGSDAARVCDCNNVSKARDRRSRVERRSKRAGRLRRDTGIHGLRLVPSGSGGHRGAGLPGTRIVRSSVPDYEARVSVAASVDLPLTPAAEVAVTLNKIERLKHEKDGLDVSDDVPRFVRDGWESIGEADRERLKWLGVFFRRQTPGAS